MLFRNASSQKKIIRFQFPLKKSSTSSVMLRAACAIHNPLAFRAIPPISTRRVESSMKKRTINRFKASRRPHLDREEVRCHDLFPMPRDGFFPRCFSTSLRRRLNAVLLQNVGNGLKRKEVAEIGQRSLNSTMAPASILLCHSSNQRNDFGSGSWASGCTVGAPVVFLGDQSSIPRQ